MARPSKLTPAVHAAIVGHVKNGLPRPAAFAAAGVSPSTGSEWIRRGEGRDDRPEDAAFTAFPLATTAAPRTLGEHTGGGSEGVHRKGEQ
ncbi:MAG: hypothetical protein O2976_05805 [Actinomycetota bacterium]|nr:hypothetical protein [Actinomycetota bacterium]